MDQVEEATRPEKETTIARLPGFAAQARLLLWLKWRTGASALRKDRARYIATIVGVIIIFPAISLGGAAALWYGLRMSPEAWSQEILHASLAGIFLFWMLSPLIAVSLSESLDLGRLFRLPISPRAILAGIVLGSFLDIATFLSVPPLLSAGAAAAGAGIKIVGGLLIAVVFFITTIFLSQVILAVAQRFLLSRAGRELLLFLTFGLTLGGALVFQALLPLLEEAVEQGQPPLLSAWLVYLPPGWAAEGMLAVSRGDLSTVLLALSGLILAGLLGLAVGARLIQSMLGREHADASGRKSSKNPGRRPFVYLPSALGALAQKEWLNIVRSAAGRIGLATATIFPLLFPLLVSFQAENAGGNTFPFFEMPLYGIAILIPLMLVMQFAANTFAYDAEGLRTLFTLPLPPWITLAAKNLAILLLIALLGGASLLVGGFILGRPEHIAPAFMAMLAYGLAFLGFANLPAAWFPKKLHVTALQNNPVPLPSALLCFLATPVLAMPSAAGLALWLILGIPWVLTLGAAFVACAAIYAAGLIAAAGMLPSFQERILQSMN